MALIAALVLPVSASAADEPSRTAVTFDAAILRPLGFVGLVVGSAAFVPAALLAWPNGRDSVDTALEIFVTAPAHDVFQRPLGDF
jgi:hypothetical protein